MSKKMMALIVFCVVFGSFAVTAIGYTVSTLNYEVELATQIEAKQKDNTSEFDNMWKKIDQVAKVTNAQKNALKEIFVEYADARTPDDAGKLVSWIHESVPNVDTTTFNNLQNTITSSRDSWTFRQKELLDYNRQHNLVLRKFPSNLVCSIFGRKEIVITIVTSSRTNEAFTTGTDDNTEIF